MTEKKFPKISLSGLTLRNRLFSPGNDPTFASIGLATTPPMATRASSAGALSIWNDRSEASPHRQAALPVFRKMTCTSLGRRQTWRSRSSQAALILSSAARIAPPGPFRTAPSSYRNESRRRSIFHPFGRRNANACASTFRRLRLAALTVLSLDSADFSAGAAFGLHSCPAAPASFSFRVFMSGVPQESA